MTNLTPSELATIRALVKLAKVTFRALDDSEEFEGDHGRCHSISGQHFDDVEEALDVLGELPDDRPGYTLAPYGKAEWALRRLLAPKTHATNPVSAAPKDRTAVLMWFEGSDIPHSVRWSDDGWRMTWDGELRTEPVAWMTIPDLTMPAPQDALPREDLAWLVVQEACETEPADEDDPECIRILRRDLKSAVLAAFLRHDATHPAPQQAAPAQGDAEDAARYRWLRHGDNDERVLQRGPVAKDYVYLPRNEKLDAMIDAARAQAKGGGK